MGKSWLSIFILIAILCIATAAVAQDAPKPVDPPVPEEGKDGADPAEPADPANPADPADPADPVDPVNPADPAEPADPAQPADGDDGAGQPDQPAQPVAAEPQQLDFHDAVIGDGGYAELFLRDGARVSVKGQKAKTVFSYRKTDLATGTYTLTLSRGLMNVRLGKNAVSLKTPAGDFALEGKGSTIGVVVDEKGTVNFSLIKESGVSPNVFFNGSSSALSKETALEFSPGGGLPIDRVEGVPGDWQTPDTMLETSHYVTADDGSVNLNLVGSWNVIRCVGDINVGSGFGGEGNALGRGVSLNFGTASCDFSQGGSNIFIQVPMGNFDSVEGAQFSVTVQPGVPGFTLVNSGTVALTFNMPISVGENGEIIEVPVTLEPGASSFFSVQDGSIVGQVVGDGGTLSYIPMSVDGAVVPGSQPPGGTTPTPQTPVTVTFTPDAESGEWVPSIEGSGDLESASPIRPN